MKFNSHRKIKFLFIKAISAYIVRQLCNPNCANSSFCFAFKGLWVEGQVAGEGGGRDAGRASLRSKRNEMHPLAQSFNHSLPL